MAALTTTAYVKTQLGISGSTQDALIAQLITAVSAQFESLTGRKFINTDYTEIYDGTGRSNLYLREYPVNSVTSVERNHGSIGDPSWTTLDADTYYVDTRTGIISSGSAFASFPGDFSKRIAHYRVIYNAGYGAAAADMPEDIQQAIAAIIGYQINTMGREGITSERTGTYSVSYSTTQRAFSAVPLASSTLDIYRRCNV